MPPKRERKHSYVVPCSSVFRDAIIALADKRDVNVADIARSIMLIIPMETVQVCPDAGEPPAGDREAVVKASRGEGSRGSRCGFQKAMRSPIFVGPSG